MSRRQIFDKAPLIYLITRGEATAENFPRKKIEILNLIKNAVESKISIVQIREKNLAARFVFELAAEAVKISRSTKTKILINDRADIALAAGAAGVQLTGASLSVEIIRRRFPPDFVVGASVHTIFEAEQARKNDADFITFSPIFATASKEKYGAPQGLKKLNEVCRKLKNFPVVALGGIDETNYKSVLEHGARGFAAIRFLNDADNLKRFAG